MEMGLSGNEWPGGYGISLLLGAGTACSSHLGLVLGCLTCPTANPQNHHGDPTPCQPLAVGFGWG